MKHPADVPPLGRHVFLDAPRDLYQGTTLQAAEKVDVRLL